MIEEFVLPSSLLLFALGCCLVALRGFDWAPILWLTKSFSHWLTGWSIGAIVIPALLLLTRTAADLYLLWPSSIMLMYLDHPTNQPAVKDVIIVIAIAAAMNVCFYAMVGTLVWYSAMPFRRSEKTRP